MPVIVPIKDLRKTNEISEYAHKLNEPIFVTKNGYSDLVVMSSELYDELMKINRVDQVIAGAEEEFSKNPVATNLDEAFEKLNKKYYG